MNNAAGSAGINTAANYRQGFLGAFLAPAPGGPMVWRPGVLPSSAWSGAVSNVDLSVLQTATASNQVQVISGNAVVPRSGAAGGPYIPNFASTSLLTTDPGASTNPRIDVVYLLLVDAALGDSGTQGAQLAIVDGTAGATPAVPAIPTGAIPLAQLYRAANSTTVTTANITDVRKSAGLGGGIRCLLPGDLNTDAGSYIGEVTYDAVTSTKSGLRYWDGAAWHGIGTRALSQPTPAANATHLGYTGTSNVGTVTIPDPGFAYRIQAVGQCYVQCNSVNPTTAAGVDALIIVGSTTYAKARVALASGSPNNAMVEVSLGPYQSFTGAQTVVFQILNANASVYLDAMPSTQFEFSVAVVPA
jgi:hypothetical protein